MKKVKALEPLGATQVALLNVYAPTGAEPPFAITQGIVLVFFIFMIVVGVKRFRSAA